MSGGGSRRGSYDTEYSDDSGDSRQNTRTFKISSSTPPKKKDLASKKFGCYFSILYDCIYLGNITISYSYTPLDRVKIVVVKYKV